METAKFKRIDLKAKPQDEQNLRKAAEKLGKTKVSQVIFDSVAQVANKPIEYYCDRVAIKQVNENISYGQIHLQNFMDEFLTVTGQRLTIEELENTFAGIGKLGSQIILQEAIQELVTKKLYDQLVETYPKMTVTTDNIPKKDLSNLFEVAVKLDMIPEIKLRFVGLYWQCYLISNEGAVSVIPDQVEKLNDVYRFTANSASELKKLALVMDICKSYNAVLEDPEVLPEKITTMVYYDKELKRFAPSGAWIKYNIFPQIFFTK